MGVGGVAIAGWAFHDAAIEHGSLIPAVLVEVMMLVSAGYILASAAAYRVVLTDKAIEIKRLRGSARALRANIESMQLVMQYRGADYLQLNEGSGGQPTIALNASILKDHRCAPWFEGIPIAKKV